MRKFLKNILLFILLMSFHSILYAQKGKLLLFSKQGKDYIYGSHIPQKYAPNKFLTRVHSNHIQKYYMHYPSARLNKRSIIDYSHTKYNIYQLSYHIFNTNKQADKYIKYWNKCPKNPYAHRNAKPGQKIVYDHSCTPILIGDFSYVDFLHANAIKVQTRTGRLVTQIKISSYPNKARKYPYQIITPAPSDEDMIRIVPQWHNAILNYVKNNGWEINAYKFSIDKSILNKPITIPKTNLSVNISANNEVEEELNHCKKPIDDAWKKYCDAKAYNAKLDADEVIEDKQIEADIKADEEEDRRIEALEKEEVRKRAIAQEAQRKQREAWSNRQNQRDKIENQELADNMQKRKEKQKEKTKAQRKIYEAKMIVHQFVDDAKDRKLYLDKIDELSNKDTTLEDAIKIKNDARKTHYDSSQLVHKKELEKQLKNAKYWDDMSKSAEFVRDTSLTINKVLAIPVVAQAAVGAVVAKELAHAVVVTKVIPFVHGAATNAIDAVYKDGVAGALVSVVKDGVDEFTLKIGGSFIDKAYRTVKYNSTGVEISSDRKAYDKDGNIVTKIKIGDRVYDEEENDITFRVMKKSTQHNLWISKAKKDIHSGDKNKEVSTTIDIWGVTEGVVDLGVKLLK